MQAKKLRAVRKLTWMESYLPKGAQIKKIRTHSIATGRLVAFGISARPPAPVKSMRCAELSSGTRHGHRADRHPWDFQRTGSSKRDIDQTVETLCEVASSLAEQQSILKPH